MRWDRNSVREGMLVLSTSGERIGKVIRCDAETFIVEKGALFPKDYQLRYDLITGASGDGSLIYSLSEIPEKDIISRLFFQERFKFAACLSPAFPGGIVVANNVLRPA